MQRDENSNSYSIPTEGELILTNCMSFCLYCDIFFYSLSGSHLFSSSASFGFALFSPASILHLNFSTPWQSFFLLACFFFFLSPCRHFYCQCQLCCLVYCCDKSSTPFISCHLCYREVEMCSLSPLLCLHWQTPLHFIIGEQIRLELGQVTQCWINGEWPWVRIYRTGWVRPS